MIILDCCFWLMIKMLHKLGETSMLNQFVIQAILTLPIFVSINLKWFCSFLIFFLNFWKAQSDVRFCVIRWATSLFDLSHCPSRYICILGAADSKLDIRLISFLMCLPFLNVLHSIYLCYLLILHNSYILLPTLRPTCHCCGL